ncbi:sugar phosphate isomerase/epimerase family protein [Clostridium tyrobutyricum]|uniref:sugar phosphate isomerase/epimerase family protein n=1 Tax=Clostridium tyrobutyricum TaxID=1519 RepID=UPI0010AB30B3|nr:sugar phosphate isomerase/epimerase [Clostridium tyrobutyricum]QCH26611.1 Xylose isomerase-like TIM barrel [Clostridium tyrobutyricum]
MKIAFDPDVLFKQNMSVTEVIHKVADLGFEYIEQSPQPRLLPFYKHPKASREVIKEYKDALGETGVKISSLIPIYRWSGPDEERRESAVRNWKRAIEIAVELDVNVINTELSGDPNQPEICEEMWYRSMEELLPILEREGIRVDIQSHPYDFCENNYETVDIVKSLRSDNVKYLYCAAHTFFYDNGIGDVKKMLEYAGDALSHVIVADTMNHTKDCRYILNPPGVDATIHQHLGIGEGEVDFDTFFKQLRKMNFGQKEDVIACVSLFGYPEKISKLAVEARERISNELSN